MKIAVTAKGNSLDDQVDPRFGRCAYFLIVDTDTMRADPIENPNLAVGGGAGIQSAQLMAEHEVEVVLTGNCGPNAYQTLNAADIQVAVGASGVIREAIEQFKTGAFSSSQGPNVASHFGTTGAAAPPAPQNTSQPPPAQMTPGMGRGGGMGRGMGMAGGMGMPSPQTPAPPNAGPPPAPGVGGDELAALRAEAQNLEAQLQAVNARLEQMQTGAAQQTGLLAVVETENCVACGACVPVCPVGAIGLDSVALVDADRCIGCARCLAVCPQNALTLRKA